MSNNLTVARPYAKAIFEHALATNKLQNWSEYLSFLTCLVRDDKLSNFLTNPSVTVYQHSQLLQTLVKELGAEVKELDAFIEVLAVQKRLLVIPDIAQLYDIMRAQHEKILEVDVISYSPLSDIQQAHLVSALKQRFERDVTLNITLDDGLLGGAIIQAGDLVIDGSIRGKLNKLSTGLAA